MARYGFPEPSPSALKKAADLGRFFALADAAFLPLPTGARFAPNYAEFAAAHRQTLELKREFAPWEAKLQAIIDHYAHSSGLRSDDIRQWDLFLAHIAAPIRRSFWEAWEAQMSLLQVYEQNSARPPEKHDLRRRVVRPASPLDPSGRGH
jgi:hypothetical protein